MIVVPVWKNATDTRVGLQSSNQTFLYISTALDALDHQQYIQCYENIGNEEGLVMRHSGDYLLHNHYTVNSLALKINIKLRLQSAPHTAQSIPHTLLPLCSDIRVHVENDYEIASNSNKTIIIIII